MRWPAGRPVRSTRAVKPVSSRAAGPTTRRTSRNASVVSHSTTRRDGRSARLQTIARPRHDVADGGAVGSRRSRRIGPDDRGRRRASARSPPRPRERPGRVEGSRVVASIGLPAQRGREGRAGQGSPPRWWPAWPRGRWRRPSPPRPGRRSCPCACRRRAWPSLPVAIAKIVSPSPGVWTGEIARANPSWAICATLRAWTLVSVALVATTPMVVFSTGRAGDGAPGLPSAGSRARPRMPCRRRCARPPPRVRWRGR